MNERRVVVTGIGAITPIGNGRKGLWQGASTGKNGIGILKACDTSGLKTKVAGEIRDFEPLDYFDKKLARRMDRFAQFALAATDMAVRDAGLTHDPKNPNFRVQ